MSLSVKTSFLLAEVFLLQIKLNRHDNAEYRLKLCTASLSDIAKYGPDAVINGNALIKMRADSALVTGLIVRDAIISLALAWVTNESTKREFVIKLAASLAKKS